MERSFGNHEEAKKAYREAEKLYRLEQNQSGLAEALLEIGDMERSFGHHDAARKAYMEAEKLYRLEQNTPGLAEVFHGIAELESRLGNSDAALKAYNEVNNFYRKIHNQQKTEKKFNNPQENLPKKNIDQELFNITLKIIAAIIILTGAVSIIIIDWKLFIQNNKRTSDNICRIKQIITFLRRMKNNLFPAALSLFVLQQEFCRTIV
ncbi:MAG: hypothetical protein ACL93V_11920 [Candidatus Electrothrix sp. YB6]